MHCRCPARCPAAPCPRPSVSRPAQRWERRRALREQTFFDGEEQRGGASEADDRLAEAQRLGALEQHLDDPVLPPLRSLVQRREAPPE